MLFLKILLVLLLIAGLAYHRVSLRISSFVFLILFLINTGFSLYVGNHSRYILSVMMITDILLLAVILVLNILPLRRKLISQKIFIWYQQKMPHLSSTEREALEAGTVGWAAELFNGKPDWQKLRNIPAAELSPEEKAFITGPVEELCGQLNDWKITHHDLDMPPEIWTFLKNQGFFGLIIPKQYGGKAFSAFAHAEILSKIYGVSATAGTTVSVPNSLGPGELLLHYGTEEQKNYYLPRLAAGQEIPCFALTSPEAGSDAASISDSGIVCKGEFEGKTVLGIRLNWNKRYITLAPCATVMGLAFKLYDPDRLLESKNKENKNNKTEYGITCALIPVNLPGITIGRRHFPLNTAFLNGPIQGREVFIPLNMLIGGIKMAGHGWQMLMECLAVGRAVSLPSTAIGGAKMAVLSTSAYAHIRHQFHLPIGKFEGISEALSRMAGNLYLMDAAKNLTLSIIHTGQKPAVLSAIMKYHLTELGRKIACDAMDIHGGKAICLGPKNYLGRFYQSIAIAITVEGANILTRSLIIFGQGALRCHRYFLEELYAGENNDLKKFDQAIWGHLGLIISHISRTLFLGLTGAYFVKNPVLTKTTGRYYQLLTRFSSAFGLIADFAVLLLGSQLKRREKISGRLGDILSYLYLISAVLKRYEDQGRQLSDLCFVDWCCQTYFFKIQQCFAEILQNFPSKKIGIILGLLIFPWGKRLKPPADNLSQQLTDAVFVPGEVRNRLTEGVFKGKIMGQLEEALAKIIAAENPEASLLLKQEAEELSRKVIAVDDFSLAELKKN